MGLNFSSNTAGLRKKKRCCNSCSNGVFSLIEDLDSAQQGLDKKILLADYVSGGVTYVAKFHHIPAIIHVFAAKPETKLTRAYRK